MGKIPNNAIYEAGIMNLKKYAKLLMNISKETPIYWPKTTETLLKSLWAK